MAKQNETDEVAKFVSGKPSKVESRGGGNGSLSGRDVKYLGKNEAKYGGDVIKVIDNIVCVNGTARGRI